MMMRIINLNETPYGPGVRMKLLRILLITTSSCMFPLVFSMADSPTTINITSVIRAGACECPLVLEPVCCNGGIPFQNKCFADCQGVAAQCSVGFCTRQDTLSSGIFGQNGFQLSSTSRNSIKRFFDDGLIDENFRYIGSVYNSAASPREGIRNVNCAKKEQQ